MGENELKGNKVIWLSSSKLSHVQGYRLQCTFILNVCTKNWQKPNDDTFYLLDLCQKVRHKNVARRSLQIAKESNRAIKWWYILYSYQICSHKRFILKCMQTLSDFPCYVFRLAYSIQEYDHQYQFARRTKYLVLFI